jgi:hypothetical protein
MYLTNNINFIIILSYYLLKYIVTNYSPRLQFHGFLRIFTDFTDFSVVSPMDDGGMTGGRLTCR